MKTQYKKHNFRESTLAVIEQANIIIEEYQDKGFNLTVRQLYYQFVARGLIANTMRSYRNLDMTLGRARLSGLIDWDAIEDRTRTINQNPHWSSPKSIITSAAQGYALDSRRTQTNYIEVWIEKNALLGVIAPICDKLDVTYLACIGYYSLSAMYKAAQRFLFEEDTFSKDSIIFHLGDHDPSGIDMTRDIQDRLDMFGCNVDVRRIALTMDQIEELKPPSNPAKTTDSRYDSYRAIFGDESWELDALPPEYISNLIKHEVNALTNKRKRNLILKQQEDDRNRLYELADEIEEI